MSLPLPQEFSNLPGGGVFNAYKAIGEGNNALAKGSAEAKYAPYKEYADVLSHMAYAQYLPYQIQAQLLSNPLLWLSMKDNPQAMKGMMDRFTSSMPTANSMNIPAPNQVGATGNGLLSGLMSKVFGGDNAMQKMPQMPQSTGQNGNDLPNPFAQPDLGTSSMGDGNAMPVQPPMTDGATNSMVPGTAGAMAGAAGKMTAPYTASPYGAGETFADVNGSTTTTPTGQTTEQAQQAILGIKNLKPIMNDISTGAEKWLSDSMKGKLKAVQALSVIKQNLGSLGGIPDSIMKSMNVSQKDLSDYAEWQSKQTQAVETILKIRNWQNNENAAHMVSDIVTPVPGEGKEYGNRVARQLQHLENTIQPNFENAMTHGFNVPAAPGVPTEQQGLPQVPTLPNIENSGSIQNNKPALNAIAAGQDLSPEALRNTPEAQNEGLAQVDLRPGESVVMIEVKTPDGVHWIIPENKYEEAHKDYQAEKVEKNAK